MSPTCIFTTPRFFHSSGVGIRSFCYPPSCLGASFPNPLALKACKLLSLLFLSLRKLQRESHHLVNLDNTQYDTRTHKTHRNINQGRIQLIRFFVALSSPFQIQSQSYNAWAFLLDVKQWHLCGIAFLSSPSSTKSVRWPRKCMTLSWSLVTGKIPASSKSNS